MENDKRFAKFVMDPKFRRIPKSERKVKIDKRFKNMFKEGKFKVKYTVDKRGRPVNTTSTEDLKRYYELSSEAESSDSDTEPPSDANVGKFVRLPKQTDVPDVDHTEQGSKSDRISKRLKNLAVDYARGESTLCSESSSDDESQSEDDGEEEVIEHPWGELDQDAEHTADVTCRLAVCNMDWDRMRAVDLMVLLNSFLPTDGLIASVTIYPSEFGLQRMKEEEAQGPTELVENKSDGHTDDNEQGSKYHMEKLRQYQLNRLKYYYAVIVCDDTKTADKVYTECDGMEYESTATKMDLRFIPDDMQFDQEPKEVCNKMPEPGKYQPRFFTTTALQQAKVDLTWDETDPNRVEVTQKLAAGNIDDVCDADLQTYLASSSGESESEDASDLEEKPEDGKKLNVIDRYKALLQDIERKEEEKNNKEVEMEVSWGINLKEKTEKLVKKKIDESQERTPFQQLLDKRKEKRKAKRDDRKRQADSDESDDSDASYSTDESEPRSRPRKNSKSQNAESELHKQKEAELELLLNDDQDNRKHFSLKKIQDRENKLSKSKRKLDADDVENDDDFEVNVKDNRFCALYTSHHYNIDPTDPQYKKTRSMDAIVQEKLSRRAESAVGASKKPKIAENRSHAELNVLVKSVKRKAKLLNNGKKQ